MKGIFLKQWIMSLLAIFLPWVVFLIEDNPGAALVAIVLQATAVGWIPASIWAWNVVHEKHKKTTTTHKVLEP